MNIGIVIKEVRKQKGLTQLDLSEHANLSKRTIQRIENDEVEPTFYSLKSVGEILEVDLLGIIAGAFIIVEILAALRVIA